MLIQCMSVRNRLDAARSGGIAGCSTHSVAQHLPGPGGVLLQPGVFLQSIDPYALAAFCRPMTSQSSS
jgi:hypothetical protein